jgi:sugar phosphate permease
VGAIVAGIALDRIFRSRWEIVCLVMGIGMVVGYITVLQYGTNPAILAVCFGLVGFMLYGPDTLLCGAGSVSVAGQRNTVAVAGLVNGVASIGPVLQEQINGRILQANTTEFAVRYSNLLGLSMSILFVVTMLIISLRVAIARRKAKSELSMETNSA